MSKLTPFVEMHEYGPAQPPPPPELVGDENKWEVEAILKHKHVHKVKSSSKEPGVTLQQKYLYLIKWLGYPHSQNSWESKDNLINAPENPGSDYSDNDFHANFDEPYDPSHPYFNHYASTPPRLSEPPIHPCRALCSPSPMVSSHSACGSPCQPLHDSIASAMRPYLYLVIHSVPSSQRACKDAHKGKSKAHSGPPEPCYNASFRSCNTPPLSQAGYKSPSPVSHPGTSTPVLSISPADLSAPTAAPAAPATSTNRLAPEASLFLSYMLSMIFRSSEVIGKHVYDQVGTTEGSFEAHTYEAIDCTSSSVLQEALKMQEAIVKIIHEDYGPSLILSFHSFLDGLPIDVVTLTKRKHGRSRMKKLVAGEHHNMEQEELEKLMEMSNRGVAIAGRRLYWARVENTSRLLQMPLQQSPSMEPHVTGLTFSLRPEEILLEGPSSMLFRHQELFQLLPSSQYLSPPSARENLVGSFLLIGSIPSTSLPVTDVHALDIGRLTAQLVVCSWVVQGLYLPSEDLRP
ncbi:hypothetical protein M404DRAFT_26091 [Pisolithus tinctorius Marx 270]|uniref:Chromo domain-containing protein n=1 Tax=Pisolithus tinctorius Marx 270 TaxID=870435 RepID=A0A0C3K4Y0_PISTI|nr:hypothetical protein M404DRAFT_26091 [Pisolithus tinctorius Marx 270]